MPRPWPVALLPILSAGAIVSLTLVGSSAMQNQPATVSVVVTDTTGAPVHVGREDLSVELDGRRVGIVSVNVAEEMQDVVVVYDDLHIGPTQITRANDIVHTLLRDAPSGYGIGLVNTSAEPSVSVPATDDRAIVRQAVRRLRARGVQRWQEEPAIDVMARLERVGLDVRMQPGASPTSVLFISDSLRMALSPSRMEQRPQAILRWWRARLELVTADVPIYATATRGLHAPYGGPLGQGGGGSYAGGPPRASLVLQMIAADTGGVAPPVTNRPDAIVSRLLSDLRARHRLTLDVSAETYRRSERLVVKTTRPGVTVRHARGPGML
jgi:hypothetical protein